MRIDILTLFPDTLGDVLSESILGRAQERGFIRIEAHQIRDYTANKQNQVDDYPYGGGRGAIMRRTPSIAAGKPSATRQQGRCTPCISPPAAIHFSRPMPFA